jgi:hypothetical protein
MATLATLDARAAWAGAELLGQLAPQVGLLGESQAETMRNLLDKLAIPDKCPPNLMRSLLDGGGA